MDEFLLATELSRFQTQNLIYNISSFLRYKHLLKLPEQLKTQQLKLKFCNFLRFFRLGLVSPFL